MAFHAAALAYIDSESQAVREDFRQFIRSNKEFWIKLGYAYKEKKSIHKAYFASICEELQINNPNEYDDMNVLMLDYVTEPSIFCRENALKALYAFGHSGAVVDAFIRLSKGQISHNRKLVADGLLQFRGDKVQLAASLYEHFDQFDAEYQATFVDFFRFSGESLKYQLIDLLKRKDTDKEVVCALLRYYRKYPVVEFKEIIQSFVLDPVENDWECISLAAAALGVYSGEDTIAILKSALSSRHWFVRFNAARSIAELGVEKDQLLDIWNGDDLYAKEQLIYHLTSREG